jgi:hypothetical protein
LVCIAAIALNVRIVGLDSAHLGGDYNQFYSASRLIGTGHLYDWDALRKIEAENGVQMPTGRLPIVLFGHKLLGGLPFRTAWHVWTAMCVVALAFFATFWPGGQRLPMIAALVLSIAATYDLLVGQDDSFWLMSFAAGLVLMEKKRDWSAGVAFSLCICKYQFALGIPIMLVAQKRWKTLISGAAAALALFAAGFLIEGPGWVVQYAKMLRLPLIVGVPEHMASVWGLASWLPWPHAIELIGIAGILGMLWWECRGNRDLGMTGAAAAACGLVAGHHTYLYDCTLMIPLTVLTFRRQYVPSWLRFWALLMLTPIPVLLLISREPFLGQLLIVGFVVTATYSAGRDLRNRHEDDTDRRAGLQHDAIGE